MSTSSPEAPPAPTSCPACGAAMDEDQEWCLECGAARTAIPAAPDWRIGLAIVLVAVAVVALVVIVAWP